MRFQLIELGEAINPMTEERALSAKNPLSVKTWIFNYLLCSSVGLNITTIVIDFVLMYFPEKLKKTVVIFLCI